MQTGKSVPAASPVHASSSFSQWLREQLQHDALCGSARHCRAQLVAVQCAAVPKQLLQVELSASFLVMQEAVQESLKRQPLAQSWASSIKVGVCVLMAALSALPQAAVASDARTSSID